MKTQTQILAGQLCSRVPIQAWGLIMHSCAPLSHCGAARWLPAAVALHSWHEVFDMWDHRTTSDLVCCDTLTRHDDVQSRSDCFRHPQGCLTKGAAAVATERTGLCPHGGNSIQAGCHQG